MKRTMTISFFIIVLLCSTLIACSYASGFIHDPAAIDEAAKSVLKILVFSNKTDHNPIATGSGFVAFNGLTLVTNYHVIEDAGALYASDDDDEVYVIDKVLCSDKKADIAILEFQSPPGLKPLKLYPNDHLMRGMEVLAIGSPKGLKNTVSTGIISYAFESEGIPMIQTTAPISPGSSGGALFNDDGMVIGVTSATYKDIDEYGDLTGAQNINFAINIAVAQAMYNAWDGTKYDIGEQKISAKMDFSSVYTYENEDQADQVVAWICPKCGRENTTNFCLECGTEKAYWVCSCGKKNEGNKFCGECGRGYEELIDEFNEAIKSGNDNDYINAISILEELNNFDSGTFETIEGKQSSAKAFISKMYYDQGLYLQANDGDHSLIIESFENAGEYSDAKDQIIIENTRYSKNVYESGLRFLEQGQFDDAIRCFLEVGDFSGAKEKVKESYYYKGIALLDQKQYEKCFYSPDMTMN